MKKTQIAKITEKATGRVWYAYRLENRSIAYVEDGSNKVTFAEDVASSKKGEKHTVYYTVDTAIGCTCKARKHRKGVACKHMKAKTSALYPAPVPTPVEKKPVKQTEEPVKGNLNGNRGFSLWKRAS